MNLNEYKAILSDIGGIQLLESFIKKDTFNNEVPEYLDTMFVEQSENSTLLYLNDCKFKYKKLDEEQFNKVKSLIEQGSFGSAIMTINSVSKLDASLKETNLVISKMLRFANDNLHLKESEGVKSLTEDWSRDLSRKTYKKAVIKNMKLTNEGNILAVIKDGNKSYLVEYVTNSRLAAKVMNSYDYLGESYSRMILSDLVNVGCTYHVTTRFDEASNLGPGTYAITSLEADGDDKIVITFVDANSGKEYKSVAKVDLGIMKEDGIEDIKSLVEPWKDEIDSLKFDDDLEEAVNKTADIVSDMAGYLINGSFGNRAATGNKDKTYSNTYALSKDIKDDAGNRQTKMFVPIDVDFVPYVNKNKEQGLKDGTCIIVDGQPVENFKVKLNLLDQDGNAWVRAYVMKPSVREILSLEEWFDELLDELPQVEPSKETFNAAYEKTRGFIKQISKDGIAQDFKKSNEFNGSSWLKEDAGALQTTDVPEKVDYGDEDKNLVKPVIKETSELVLEAWLVDLINRGFEPDAEGFLNRGGKYLVREKDNLEIKYYTELWEADGTPIDPNLDIVSILD